MPKSAYKGSLTMEQPQPIPQPILYTRKELSEIFGVSPRTIVKWGRENKLQRVVLGKRTIRYLVKFEVAGTTSTGEKVMICVP